MILNLLDLAKGDEGKLFARRVDVDIHSLARDVLGELEVAARARRVRLESHIEATRVRADEDLLRRLLVNLLDNASRHAPPDTVVTLSAVSSVDGVDLRVTDRGPGVPAELRERVFDPFVQVEAKERETIRGNRGLGLAFCKLAVEAHAGRIWVDDASPGAVFCVRIPHDA